jgi:hypothetical protein
MAEDVALTGAGRQQNLVRKPEGREHLGDLGLDVSSAEMEI